ncbi:MAG TPA: 16S rRNA (cytosine(1402)-N(4))-methyltransferase RsmH [Candidatus Saccharimonadia bacterium]|nr:16S rRNA (cytosine(1402)-N(4))-methyltransferase RsmH [Candidatus Saccharimonadia bacterium]
MQKQKRMKNIHQNKKDIHIPVLFKEVLTYLDPKTGNSYLDLTAGFGGHVERVVSKTKNSNVTLIDRDNQAISYLKEKFSGKNYEIMHSDFLSASKMLLKENRKYDLIFADLGVSSLHLNEASRGFSFQSSGPLDMRMDLSQSLKADQIINNYKLSDLDRVIRDYGEEAKHRKVANLIVNNRPISTTTELAQIIRQAWPGYSRVHPATKTFQAIRILVNDELNQLKEALPIWVDLLNSDGRLAVISFHSLEDRIIKQYFSENAGNNYDSRLKLLTPKPITPNHEELVKNPRSRSAKLRVVAK